MMDDSMNSEWIAKMVLIIITSIAGLQDEKYAKLSIYSKLI